VIEDSESEDENK
jgi:hypothetical protein